MVESKVFIEHEEDEPIKKVDVHPVSKAFIERVEKIKQLELKKLQQVYDKMVEDGFKSSSFPPHD